MSVGHIYRTVILQNTITWRGTDFILNDLIEIFIIFGFITILLIFSNREQQKLLDRSTRSEYMLKRERDTLEVKVDERTKEIKQLQMDHIGELYRFVEFGKLSSGLFHDLMSPVQALKIYTDASKQKDMEPAMAKQFAGIQNISGKIESMLQTMRTQIRIDSQAEDFDVLSDIRDIVQMTRYLHLKHNIDIDVLCDTDTYEVTTKRTILNHVLLNLISNACEACIPQSRERECRILIRVGPNTGAELRHYISIEDTGVGIDPKDLEKIFDPFFTTKQVEKQTDKQTINCGIGLSSSKHAIQKQLQGKLYVESDLGVGTTMTILF